MLKNTKFLYCIIAILLVICILCGMHIAIDRKIMYEARTHFVYNFSATTEGVSEWITAALDNENSEVSLYSSVASAKNYLEDLMENCSSTFYLAFRYNDLFTEKYYFTGSSEFYYSLLEVNSRFDLILENIEKTGELSEEDRGYLEKAEKAFSSLFSALETDGILNEKAVKSDTYLTYACLDFIKAMR